MSLFKEACFSSGFDLRGGKSSLAVVGKGGQMKFQISKVANNTQRPSFARCLNRKDPQYIHYFLVSGGQTDSVGSM